MLRDLRPCSSASALQGIHQISFVLKSPLSSSSSSSSSKLESLSLPACSHHLTIIIAIIPSSHRPRLFVVVLTTPDLDYMHVWVYHRDHQPLMQNCIASTINEIVDFAMHPGLWSWHCNERRAHGLYTDMDSCNHDGDDAQFSNQQRFCMCRNMFEKKARPGAREGSNCFHKNLLRVNIQGFPMLVTSGKVSVLLLPLHSRSVCSVARAFSKSPRQAGPLGKRHGPIPRSMSRVGARCLWLCYVRNSRK